MQWLLRYEFWSSHGHPDIRKAMHKSPPCIRTGGLKNVCKLWWNVVGKHMEMFFSHFSTSMQLAFVSVYLPASFWAVFVIREAVFDPSVDFFERHFLISSTADSHLYEMHVRVRGTLCSAAFPTYLWIIKHGSTIREKSYKNQFRGRPELSTFSTYEITSHNFSTPSPPLLMRSTFFTGA